MSLTRATMTSEEATTLAAAIDKTHLPFRVKRIVAVPGGRAAVEVEDEQTGYVLPIVSPEHWKRFAAQSGNAGALDTFGETGTRVLAYLDTVIKKLETQRDDLLAQAEQFDERVRQVLAQKGDIEKAVAAVDAIGSFVPQLRQPQTGLERTLSAENPEGTPDFLGDPPAVAVTPKKKWNKRHPAPIGKLPGNQRRRTPSGETQKEWTMRELRKRGRARVMDLAADLAPLLELPKENVIKSISSLLSYEIKNGHPQIVRAEMGWYEWHRFDMQALRGRTELERAIDMHPRGPLRPVEALTLPQAGATTGPAENTPEPEFAFDPAAEETPDASEA